MRNITDFFTFNTTESANWHLDIFEFTGSIADFVAECAYRFRLAYASDEDIDGMLAAFPKYTREQVLELKVPNKANMMSGEFGEILSYYFAIETWAQGANIRPMKWRWKEMPNMASHGSDIILLRKLDPDADSTDDTLVSIEAKAHATTPEAGKSSLNDAVNDASKDASERAVKTISYLKGRYMYDKNYELLKQCERFEDPVGHPFLKIHAAVAIVDSSDRDVHLSNMDSDLLANNPGIKVFLMPIADMKTMYESMFNQIKQS